MLCLDDILSTLNRNAKLLRELYYVQTTFDKEVDLANVEYLKPYPNFTILIVYVPMLQAYKFFMGTTFPLLQPFLE